MAKLLNFYDEVSTLFERPIGKMDGALIDQHFQHLSAEQKSQLIGLMDELMMDRNGLFPDGYGADAVDSSEIPEIKLPRWSSLVASSNNQSPGLTTDADNVHLPPKKAEPYIADKMGASGIATMVGVYALRQDVARYGQDSTADAIHARKLLQMGDRLWSDRAKRLHARFSNRKKEEFLRIFIAFQSQVGPDFQKLSPELAVALKALAEKINRKRGHTLGKERSMVKLSSPSKGARGEIVAEKRTVRS